MERSVKTYLGKLFSFKVYEVDPEGLKEIDAAWEGSENEAWGSHGYLLATYVPQREIWVNKNVPVRDKILTIGHELIEACLMKEGVPYELAHWVAELSERELYRYISVKFEKSFSTKRKNRRNNKVRSRKSIVIASIFKDFVIL